MELDGVMNREMFRGFYLCRHAMLLSWIKKPARDKSVAGRNSQKAVLACKPESNKLRGQTGQRFAMESKSHGACAPVAVIQEAKIYPSDSRRAHATWIWTSTNAELLNMNTPPFLID
jgi:hypothetical protein